MRLYNYLLQHFILVSPLAASLAKCLTEALGHFSSHVVGRPLCISQALPT
jgi:hypothetical protein